MAATSSPPCASIPIGTSTALTAVHHHGIPKAEFNPYSEKILATASKVCSDVLKIKSLRLRPADFQIEVTRTLAVPREYVIRVKQAAILEGESLGTKEEVIPSNHPIATKITKMAEDFFNVPNNKNGTCLTFIFQTGQSHRLEFNVRPWVKKLCIIS